MNSVIDDFNERVSEIDQYLQLLQLLSLPTAKIHCENQRSKSINGVALKTMKASCFLMLYNLVESSIRGSMIKLYEKMNSENKGLREFDIFVKELWVAQQFKNIDPFSSNQTSYRNLIKSMVEEALNSAPVFLDSRNLPISGNLDAKKIRELFDAHKISTHAHYRALHGAELKTIKDNRNLLAHGDQSFSGCGQQYTVQAIIGIKKQTVIFLRSALKNVSKYIESSKYVA